MARERDVFISGSVAESVGKAGLFLRGICHRLGGASVPDSDAAVMEAFRFSLESRALGFVGFRPLGGFGFSRHWGLPIRCVF